MKSKEDLYEAAKQTNFKKDKIYIFAVVLILTLLFYLTRLYFGNLLYDTGREFLVPDAILQGKIPVKDIFISYFPLSYQINAVLFKIFGSNFDTLRIAGIVSAIAASVFIYLVSRFFTDCKKALIITLIIAFTVMFNVSYLFNYVMGISYAFIYAVLSLFISLYFAMHYLKEGKFLYLSYFFLGLCFALKAEFVFLYLPFLFLPIYKKAGSKKLIFAHLISFIPILLSFGALFIKGFNFSDLINYFIFLKRFLSSKVLAHYNEVVFNTKEPILWAKSAINSIKLFLMLFLPFLLFFISDIKKNTIKFGFIKIIFAVFSLILIIFVFIPNFSACKLYSFLCITALFILYHSIKHKNFPLVFLTLVQLALSIRVNFLYTLNYSAFLLPAGLLVNIIFLLEFIKNDVFKKVFMTFLLAVSSINILYFLISMKITSLPPVYTERGKIIPGYDIPSKTIKEILYFMKSVDKDKTVLILPEGAMFNYLADRKTNLKYYQLLPNHIEALREDLIVDDLTKTPPDYILISDIDYSIYGTPLFCKDFGFKICDFTVKNYNLKGTINNGENLTVYVYAINKE